MPLRTKWKSWTKYSRVRWGHSGPLIHVRNSHVATSLSPSIPCHDYLLFPSPPPSPCYARLSRYYPLSPITINIFLVRNLDSPSVIRSWSAGKKSDNNPVLRWGKEKKRDEFAEQFFDFGGGERKNCEIWMELLQFSSPEHVSSFVDLHPISMSRRYSNVTKNVWKEGKEEGIRALRTFVPTTRTKFLEICVSKDYVSRFISKSYRT